ncbi:MAG: sugar transferase [Myxococcota bacterium]
MTSLRRTLKGLADRAGAAGLLVAASPVLVLAAAAIRAEGVGPVLFTQERTGKGGRPFRLYKLRTMREAHGPDGAPLPDELRLTRLGRLLRATSVDELPQLWNVLKGDMSLVGPRPLLPRYLPRYSPEQARRHEVLPGLTGWAQVNGRNALSWEEKFRLDTWYVDHWSLRLDARILAMTALRVVRRSGIAGEGSETMHEFTGSEPR